VGRTAGCNQKEKGKRGTIGKKPFWLNSVKSFLRRAANGRLRKRTFCQDGLVGERCSKIGKKDESKKKGVLAHSSVVLKREKDIRGKLRTLGFEKGSYSGESQNKSRHSSGSNKRGEKGKARQFFESGEAWRVLTELGEQAS